MFPVIFNVAQECIFGIAPSKNDCRPMWMETADRLVRAALNQRQPTSFVEVAANSQHGADRRHYQDRRSEC